MFHTLTIFHVKPTERERERERERKGKGKKGKRRGGVQARNN